MASPTPNRPARPSQPGWYVDPDGPGRLRHWDGRAWSGRTRPRPGWLSQAYGYDVGEDDFERSSAEGPAHSEELQAPLARAAGPAKWRAPWWPGGARPGARWWGPARRLPPARALRPPPAASRLGQARRPLFVMASLIAVAAVVVVSSVVMTQPTYEPSGQPAGGGQLSLASFSGRATKYCASALPRYRPVLAAEADGPSIAAAAHQVDLLRLKLATIPTSRDMSAPVGAWLQYWRDFASYQRRYARIIGPARHRNGRTEPSPRASRPDASQALYEAQWSASSADTYSNLLRAPACRLEATPGRGLTAARPQGRVVTSGPTSR